MIDTPNITSHLLEIGLCPFLVSGLFVDVQAGPAPRSCPGFPVASGRIHMASLAEVHQVQAAQAHA